MFLITTADKITILKVTSWIIIITILLGEVIFRFMGINTPPGEFEERYKIDGLKSKIIGYHKGSNIYPWSLKPNFNHWVEDSYWYRKPALYKLDENGYRGKSGCKTNEFPEILFIGDSTTFGIGVNKEETFPDKLSNRLEKCIYNMSVSGLGPASYLAMINEYLEKYIPPKKVIISFYTSNDYHNLWNSRWLLNKKTFIPTSKIIRIDGPIISESFNDLPVWLLTKKFIKDSYFISSVYQAWQRINGSKLGISIANIENKYSLLFNHINLAPQVAAIYTNNIMINKALHYATALQNASCVPPNIVDMINIYQQLINQNKYQEATNIGDQIVETLMKLSCHPIDKKELINLTSYFTYYGTVKIFQQKTKGVVKQYQNYLTALRSNTIHKKYWNKIDIIINEIQKQSSSVAEKIIKLNNLIKYDISSYLSNNGWVSMGAEEMIDSFLNSLLVFRKKYNINILVATWPGEYQIRTYNNSNNMVCKKASNKGLPCLDIGKFIYKYYSKTNNSALYLDGSHFLEAGHQLVADILTKKLKDIITK